MARTGRPRKPTILKIIQGNPGKRPLPKNEPSPRPPSKSELAPPEVLDLDAKKEWNRIAPELDRMGLLTKLDRTILAAYCDNYSRWIKAAKELKATGLTVEGAKGGEITSPFIKIVRDAQAACHRFAVEFGFTPASRTRIAAPEKDPGDEKKRKFWG